MFRSETQKNYNNVNYDFGQLSEMYREHIWRQNRINGLVFNSLLKKNEADVVNQIIKLATNRFGTITEKEIATINHFKKDINS